MRFIIKTSRQPHEQGNALFLILIAVALFAALSYAVTSSGRGGASTSKEQATLAAAQLLQIGATMKTAVLRQTITGTDATSLYFSTGAGGKVSVTGTVFDLCASGANCFWAPDGPGIPVPSFPPNITDEVSGGPAPYWIFFSYADARAIKGAGQDNVAEPYMMYYNLKKDICTEINRQMGLGAAIPTVTVSSPASPQPAGTTLRDAGFTPSSPIGCYYSPSYYYFYYALAEN